MGEGTGGETRAGLVGLAGGLLSQEGEGDEVAGLRLRSSLLEPSGEGGLTGEDTLAALRAQQRQVASRTDRSTLNFKSEPPPITGCLPWRLIGGIGSWTW